MAQQPGATLEAEGWIPHSWSPYISILAPQTQMQGL